MTPFYVRVLRTNPRSDHDGLLVASAGDRKWDMARVVLGYPSRSNCTNDIVRSSETQRFMNLRCSYRKYPYMPGILSSTVIKGDMKYQLHLAPDMKTNMVLANGSKRDFPQKEHLAEVELSSLRRLGRFTHIGLCTNKATLTIIKKPAWTMSPEMSP